jgi:hypothetical protein
LLHSGFLEDRLFACGCHDTEVCHISVVGGGSLLDPGRLATGARPAPGERTFPNIVAPRHRVGDIREPLHN